MANYKEQNVNGISWRRCSLIQISNPHSSKSQQPSASFIEEDIVDTGNGKYIISQTFSVPPINVPINPMATFDIYDPTTGQKVEGQSMTHAQLYGILYSAYRTEAEKRDVLFQNHQAALANLSANTANT